MGRNPDQDTVASFTGALSRLDVIMAVVASVRSMANTTTLCVMHQFRYSRYQQHGIRSQKQEMVSTSIAWSAPHQYGADSAEI